MSAIEACRKSWPRFCVTPNCALNKADLRETRQLGGRLSVRCVLCSETHEPQAVSHGQLPQVHASTGKVSHRRRAERYDKNGSADIRCGLDPSMISQYRRTTCQEWWVVFLFQAISPMRLPLDDAISLSYRGATSAPEKRLWTKLQPSSTAFGKLTASLTTNRMLLIRFGNSKSPLKSRYVPERDKGSGKVACPRCCDAEL